MLKIVDKPTEAGKRQGRTALQTGEGAWPCQHLDSGLESSRAERRSISAVLNHPVCGTLFSAAVGNECTLAGSRGRGRPRGPISAGAQKAMMATLPQRVKILGPGLIEFYRIAMQ